MNKSIYTAYYHVKPWIPRSAQLALRRLRARRARHAWAGRWPIDVRAGVRPPGWPGWPREKRFAVVLTHDVEQHQGQQKCPALMKLEEQYQFRSAFNFVPERYAVSEPLRGELQQRGFEVGVHGLRHDGLLYASRQRFCEQARRINHYLRAWGAAGFRSPSMQHNLEWLHDLEIEYDASTFDVDPFEPQSDGVGTIFPLWVSGARLGQPGYIELPYTLAQDHTLFVILREPDIGCWREKLDWIVERGGMVLLDTHPDYMSFDGAPCGAEEYPVRHYEALLNYLRAEYAGAYWNVLPRELARWARTVLPGARPLLSGGRS